MDFDRVKSLFKGKNKTSDSDSRTGKANRDAGQSGRAGGGKGAGKGSRGNGGGKNAGSGKIAPVSPSRARLERRANDEKIIRNIKIAFTTVITIAIIGIILSIFLYVYKPTVATVGGAGISQFEFIYQLRMASTYASEYSTSETIGQQSINAAAEMKIYETLAKERGIALTDEDKDNINYQIDYIDQIAASSSTGESKATTGDDYLRGNLGINKSQYRKIMESETLANSLIDMEYEQIEIPDEDAQAIYDEDIASYDEATVRHILFLYEGESEESPRTQEESEQLAIDTVSRINAGEDMAELVQELSEDSDLSNEGIYTFKRNDGYEQGFLDWSFDPARQIGDVGICETSYGYHVMRLEDSRVVPFDEVKEDIVNEIKSQKVDAITESWKNDQRFQLQINQGVYDSVVKQVLGE